jgi:hypothetical protein
MREVRACKKPPMRWLFDFVSISSLANGVDINGTYLRVVSEIGLQLHAPLPDEANPWRHCESVKAHQITGWIEANAICQAWSRSDWRSRHQRFGRDSK